MGWHQIACRAYWGFCVLGRFAILIIAGIINGIKTRFETTGVKGHELLGINGYRNLHKWVVKTLGQPEICSKCGKSGLIGRQIHWANKSGRYKKDKNDWIRLCVKCHFHKDKI